MADDNDKERTEKATPRRRQKAREEGRVARSRELTAMAGMGGILLIFLFFGAFFMSRMSALTGGLLSFRYGSDPLTVVRAVSLETGATVAPFLAVAFVVSLAAALLQGGIVAKPIKVDMERLNPLNGLKRLFSAEGLGNFLKSLVEFIVGGVVVYLIIDRLLPSLPQLAAIEMRHLYGVSLRFIGQAVLSAFGAFAVMAVLDYLLERWKFERSIKMTKDDLREEYKETEGDPTVKARIKSLQREMARRRMMQEVPKATVVITNPTHLAVAILYDKAGMAAPKIIAKGAGYVAEKIRTIARAHGVPVVEDKPLARALFPLALGSFIPEQLYRAVAKILAYIYKLKGKTA